MTICRFNPSIKMNLIGLEIEIGAYAYISRMHHETEEALANAMRAQEAIKNVVRMQ